MPAKPARSTTTVHHPRYARMYARESPRLEEAGLGERRDELLAGLRGRVVEIGAGNGMNFRHYPVGVTHVLAVEPEPLLRELAGREAEAVRRTTGVPIEVVDGTADRLPADDGSFDAAIASLVLCSVSLAPARRSRASCPAPSSAPAIWRTTS